MSPPPPPPGALTRLLTDNRAHSQSSIYVQTKLGERGSVSWRVQVACLLFPLARRRMDTCRRLTHRAMYTDHSDYILCPPMSWRAKCLGHALYWIENSYAAMKRVRSVRGCRNMTRWDTARHQTVLSFALIGRQGSRPQGLQSTFWQWASHISSGGLQCSRISITTPRPHHHRKASASCSTLLTTNKRDVTPPHTQRLPHDSMLPVNRPVASCSTDGHAMPALGSRAPSLPGGPFDRRSPHEHVCKMTTSISSTASLAKCK